MRTSTAIQIGAVTIAVLDVAATVEALRSGRPAVAVVAALAGAGAIGLAWLARRPTVELRGDLATWTARTAAATGAPETDIVNRAVARHRATLDAERTADG